MNKFVRKLSELCNVSEVTPFVCENVKKVILEAERMEVFKNLVHYPFHSLESEGVRVDSKNIIPYLYHNLPGCLEGKEYILRKIN